jgi:ABC-type glutathione transport system ATPase component
MALLLITHQEDVALAACDRRVAMGERTALPVPAARSTPSAPRGAVAPLLRARSLVREVDGRRLLDEVDLDVGAGECVAIVGRSGSGKTTLARALLQLVPADSGEVVFDGREINALRGRELRRVRRRMQLVFQDPYASLDPRQTVGAAVAEPLRVHRLAGRLQASARAAALLEQVGLDRDAGRRLPHQFSGGQRQRVAIARALACGPDLLIADEPVTALDAAARSRILDLLAALRASGSMALVLIAHDLAVVAGLADRIVVLERGRVVEVGSAAELLARPQHAETRRLLGEVV